MLTPDPEIHEKIYVNWLCPFFPFPQWTHVCSLMWQKPTLFCSQQIFLCFFLFHIACSNVWLEGTIKQLHSQNFIRDLEIISLYFLLNPFTPNGHYSGRTAPLTSTRWILNIYSTNISNEYFKHTAQSQYISLQKSVYFIMLPCLVPVLFTF
jgi:thiosulfate reductase cytochrome b subunit